MTIFKTIMKWIGLGIGIFVAGIWAINSDFVSILLPVRTLFPVLLGIAGLLALIRRSKFSSASAVIFAILGVYIFISGRMGYSEQTIQFENAGATLEGTLYIPDGAGPFPAVVIVQGSPCIPRRLYHTYAHHMVLNGIAVYSFDKRGTGNSGGVCNIDNNTSPENLALLTGDVVAALATIEDNRAVDPSRLGLWGLSQAGWTSPLAAKDYPDLAFMVTVSGPTVSVGEEDYYSKNSGDSNLWARDEVIGAKADALVDARLPSMFDPVPLLQEFSIPGLWVYGGLDGSIPVRKNIKNLETLQALGKPYGVLLYPKSTHVLVETTFPYNFSDGFQESVVEWIKAQPAKTQ